MGEIIGHIDRVDTKEIAGWLLDKDNPIQPIAVDIVFRNQAGQEIARRRCECDGSRPDLVRQFRTSRGAFVVQISEFMPASSLELVGPLGVVNIGFQGAHTKTIPIAAPGTAPWVPDKPSLPPRFLEILTAKLESASTYLEYGSGGSTVLAVRINHPVVYTVESDQHWLKAVEEKCAKLPGNGKLHPIYIDIGESGPLGYPKNDDRLAWYFEYSLKPWQRLRSDGCSPDVVLVDGRFRLASFFSSILYSKPGATIYFDDYIDRKQYHAAAQLLQPTRMIDRVAEFIVPKSIKKKQAWDALAACLDDAR